MECRIQNKEMTKMEEDLGWSLQQREEIAEKVTIPVDLTMKFW